METLRGIIPSVPTETVEFTKSAPTKWKCDKCGVITGSLWRCSSALTNGYGAHLNGGGGGNSTSSSSLVPYCAHRFCGICLETVFLGVQTVGKCPLDAVTVYKKQMIETVANVDSILSQEVYCSHKSRGCRKTMLLSELESHLKSCLYGLVHCPLKCGQGVTIKSLPSHMATECPRRVIACDHCEEDIVLESKAEHEAVCPRKPVVCAYCKNKGLLRGELKEHLERCELKPRNCRLIPLGCKFSGTQSEVEKHESEWTAHMDIFLKNALQNGTITQDKPKNRLNDIVNIVKNLNAENAELMDRVNELTEKVEALEESNRRLTEKLSKHETVQKADIASIRTVIELMRKELENFKLDFAREREEDEESEV
ncbi:TNF receptor-associated factor 4 [Tyrophagus putrescentiae]|nr:TNF receptor-associated factor 4 [Tyrophagus putrescentiae]